MKILVIALSGIGDALMFTPSLDKLKIEFPSAEIDVLAMYGGVRDIFNKLPDVNNVIYYDFMNSSIIKTLNFVLKLRGKYDVSINVYPSNRREYNGISWLIGAKKRLAAKYIRMDFQNLGFLNNIRVMEDDSQHNVVTNFKLVSALSNKHNIEISSLKMVLSQEDIDFANNFLEKKNISADDIIIGFHAGCSTMKNHNKRRWSVDNFAELGKLIINNHNSQILLFGGNEEEHLKQCLYTKINSPNVILVNAHSLTSSAAVMQRSNLFVTNDSSLLHVASALKLKIIPLIGPTNINYIHPWQTEYKTASLNLDCSPCFFYSPKPLVCNRTDLQFKCIKELSVELVYKIVKEMLN
jgi:heptosyltransferase-2